MHRALVILFLTGIVFGIPCTAHAQKATPRNLGKANLDYLLFMIQGDNFQESLSAIAELGKRKNPESLDMLLMQLLLGYPPQYSKAMIEALGKRKDPRAMETLVFYSRHRSPELRVEALAALSSLEFKDPASVKAINELLLKALRDMSEPVRNKAAWLLAQRKVFDAEEPLLILFSRGSTTAMEALGSLGGIRTAHALAIALEDPRAPREPLVRTMGTLLSRADFGAEPVRIQLVKILGKINLPGAQNVLMVYHASGPDAFPRSRKLAFQILSK